MIDHAVPASSGLKLRGRRLAAACLPVVQGLEDRCLFSAATIQGLPFLLDFSADRGELLDRDGQGIGFTRVQANKLGTEYQPSLIDLDTAAGVLRVTTSGSSTSGTNSGTVDNTMVNGLETQFDGTNSFTITARLIGPLGFLNASFDQAGIYFGPDQDNFVKLVAIRSSSGQVLQFKDEIAGSTTSLLPAPAQAFNIGSFTAIRTLDVRITGNSATGVVSARFAVNGASFTSVPYDLTLPAATRAAFFNSASRAGIMQFTKNDGPAITATYDSFRIDPGEQPNTPFQPLPPGPHAQVSKTTYYFNDVQAGSSGGAGASEAQILTITNIGTADLPLPADGLTITGANAGEFAIAGANLPLTISPGQSITLNLAFTAAAVGIRTATLTIKSSDTASPLITINLRGLGTTGTGGNNEPSLQRILDLYQIPVNVGDDDPDTTAFPVPPLAGNDEIEMQRLLKAGDGPVSIDLLAVFDNAKTPAAKFGWYDPGTPSTKTELFTVPNSADSQSVAPGISGVTTFDPSGGPFSLYGVFPAFTNREVYSEDALNTWESNTANRRKIRFYPLKNSDGTVVPNSFVFAFEEYNVTYDQNDIVGIIRNVKPAPAGPEIGLANADGAPSDGRLVFSRISNLDTDWPNVFHDKSVLTIRNTGNQDLTISSLVIGDTSAFQLLGINGSVPFTIPAGASQNVTVQFIGSSSTALTKSFTSTLTVNSNDADDPQKVVKLAGWWQLYSEMTPSGTYVEPSLADVIKLFGYSTKVSLAGEVLDTGGQGIKVGQETLSPYWFRADGNIPVTVRLLAAFHRQNNTDDLTGKPTNAASTISYYFKGSSASPTKLFQHNTFEGQSFLPHLSGSTTNYAIGTFSPTGSTPFGFKVDSRFSDDTLNPLDNGMPGTGHSFRFYAARDANGNLIPNTYIVAQDYTGLSYSNYDYQDNIYLVSNVRPASPPTPPANLSAAGTTAGVTLTWDANHEGNLAGYRVYRSDSPDGVYTLLTTTLLETSVYADIAAPGGGAVSYYRVTAVDVHGGESLASTASGTRAADTTPPAAPVGLQATGTAAGIDLDWSDNLEPDLAGYDVYRSDSAEGTFVKLNDALLTASQFTDTTAPGGFTSFYRVVAIDSSGNASSYATASAFRPAVGVGGQYNTMAYDSGGVLHFAWYDGIDRQLKYATRSAAGAWSAVQIVDRSGDDTGQFLSLAIDRKNHVAIAYFDATSSDLRYASLNGSTWTVQTIDSRGSVGGYPSLVFDRNNLPGIAYYRKTSGDLRYAHFTGSKWLIWDVDTTGDSGRSASMAMNPATGLMTVAYEYSTAGSLRFAQQDAKGNWKASTIAAGQGVSFMSHVYDLSGRATLSYYDAGPANLRYAVLKNGVWRVDTIATRGAVGAYSQLRYDPKTGKANILYYNKNADQVQQATGFYGSWSIRTVQPAGGRFISAAAVPGSSAASYAWFDLEDGMLQVSDVL